VWVLDPNDPIDFQLAVIASEIDDPRVAELSDRKLMLRGGSAVLDALIDASRYARIQKRELEEKRETLAKIHEQSRADDQW
jgi:hypothetical protein